MEVKTRVESAVRTHLQLRMTGGRADAGQLTREAHEYLSGGMVQEKFQGALHTA
jgi:hypothetical protein